MSEVVNFPRRSVLLVEPVGAVGKGGGVNSPGRGMRLSADVVLCPGGYATIVW